MPLVSFIACHEAEAFPTVNTGMRRLSPIVMAWMDDNRPYGAEERDGAAAPLRDADHAQPGADIPSRGPRIRIIRNPRSHRNAASKLDEVPAGVEVIEPSRRGDTARALVHCQAAGTDCLIIDGGDGTVRDVLTAGLDIFGDQWPLIGVLPRGKTNALAIDLRIPDHWSWADVARHAARHCTAGRRPLVLRREDATEPPVAGFLMGAGSFTTGIEAAQDAHRLGMFGGFAVGMTVGWAILQIIFGRSDNRWRRGQPMDVRLLPSGETLPHAGARDGRGDTDHRSILVASTLRRLPLGLKPLGTERDGLKLLVVDRALRRMWAAAPLILAGRTPRWAQTRGLHQIDVEGLQVRFSQRFILDGEFLTPGVWRIEQGPLLQFVTP